MTAPTPILSIAGSDSSAGAGIQADLKTITALGGYALTAVTSVVSETPGKVSMVRLMEPEIVEDQIRILFEALPIRAVKVGMVGGRDQIAAVDRALRALDSSIPIVIDPVMVATGGGRLLEEDAIQLLTTALLPRATVITPNMDEAAVLWDRPVKDRAEMEACATDLATRYQTAVLVKGGHLTDGTAADVLCGVGEPLWLESPSTPGVHTHGTGCTYSAAIATGLGHGLALADAVRQAKEYISRAIRTHFRWQVGSGTVVDALHHLDPQK